MADRGGIVPEGVRIARGIVADPSGVVALWNAATGGKAAGCLPAASAPEILLAAGLLPVSLDPREDIPLPVVWLDAWLIGPDPERMPPPGEAGNRFFLPREAPSSMEEALDRLEALSEWAGGVTGIPASEGGLWKSIRACAGRRSLLDALGDRCRREPGFLAAEERTILERAGGFLPPEAHSRILSLVLGLDPEPSGIRPEGDKGDPLIVLARRIFTR